MAKKNQGGRPPKYNSKFHIPWARNLARQGLTIEEIAAELEIGKTTIYRWMDNDDEFRNAINEGRSYSDSMVEDALYRRALGGTYTEQRAEAIPGKSGKPNIQKQVTIKKEVPPDTAAAIFWLKNRQPDKWRDKREYVPEFASMEFEDELSKSLRELGESL